MWSEIRQEFLRVKRERGLTQVQIATAGHTRQHLISKWSSNRKQGPVVGNWMRAIAGLGLSPAEFFAGLEQRRHMPPAPAPTKRPANLFISHHSMPDIMRELEILKKAIEELPVIIGQRQCPRFNARTLRP